ncbi:hypothetical protein ABMA10_22155 [Plantibacter sp. RU18]
MSSEGEEQATGQANTLFLNVVIVPPKDDQVVAISPRDANLALIDVLEHLSGLPEQFRERCSTHMAIVHQINI